MPKHCVSCGEVLKEGIKFCGNCGTKINDVEHSSSIKSTTAKHQGRSRKTIAILVVVILAVAVVASAIVLMNLFKGKESQENLDNTGNASSPIGKWFPSSSGEDGTFEFMENGSAKDILFNEDHSQSITWIPYKIENNLISLTIYNNPVYFNYELSNNNQHLVLTLGETTYTYDRIPDISNSFIGKWKVVSQAEHYLTFYSNNSIHNEGSYQGQTLNSWHNYVIQNNELHLYPEGDMIYTMESACMGTNSTYSFQFSNGNLQIILMNEACGQMILNKNQ